MNVILKKRIARPLVVISHILKLNLKKKKLGEQFLKQNQFLFIITIDFSTVAPINMSPCHRREFNPTGGPYKMFQMILSFVTKTFQNMLVFKILNEGKWCFWHSISIT